MKMLWFVISMILFPLAVLAQMDNLPTMDSIQMILAVLSTGKMVGLGLVAAIVQILMIGLRTELVVSKLGKLKPSVRLAMVAGLSLVGGVISLVQSGTELIPALVHSTTLAAFQVFGHQIYTVYLEKKQENK